MLKRTLKKAYLNLLLHLPNDRIYACVQLSCGGVDRAKAGHGEVL